MKKIKRPVVELDVNRQYELLSASSHTSRGQSKIVHRKNRVFKEKDPHDIYLNNIRLEDHLKETGFSAPFVIRELLEDQDWGVFESQYQGGGRAAYSPRAMVGLILYGVMHGVTSLRELEKLSRVDLGCMWITGGIMPDHSIIGRFIQRHEEPLTTDFFMSLTAAVLKKTGTDIESLAGDGTVVEAAASRYHLIKKEAAQQKLATAQAELAQSPGDEGLQSNVRQAEQVATLLEERREKRRAHRYSTDNVCISAVEPQEMVQPLKKSKCSALSYKPSVLSNDGQVIVSFAIDPSSETAVLPLMLETAETVGKGKVKELLLDGGYHSKVVLEEAIERDISLLCSPGTGNSKRHLSKQKATKYTKDNFKYDAKLDCYICPRGEKLKARQRHAARGTEPAYTVYVAKGCNACSLRTNCTTSKTGRQIKRYEGDELKEALHQVMSHPQAKKRYSQRKVIVEPVFSRLKLKQGLQRFRRKGLKAVRVEFALHVLAYNISRVVAYIVHFFLYIWFRLINLEFRTAYKAI